MKGYDEFSVTKKKVIFIIINILLLENSVLISYLNIKWGNENLWEFKILKINPKKYKQALQDAIELARK